MKRFLVLLVVVGLFPLLGVGCVKTSNQVFDGGNNPSVIVVDNHTNKQGKLFVDGKEFLIFPAADISSLRLKDKAGIFIFSIKFSDGSGGTYKMCVRPGSKISISVFEENGGIAISSSQAGGRRDFRQKKNSRNEITWFSMELTTKIHGRHVNRLRERRKSRY